MSDMSRSEAHRELVDYLVTHMTDAWEGYSQRDRAWMAGVIEEVLFLLYHAEDLGVLERAMGERFVTWWKGILARLHGDHSGEGWEPRIPEGTVKKTGSELARELRPIDDPRIDVVLRGLARPDGDGE